MRAVSIAKEVLFVGLIVPSSCLAAYLAAQISANHASLTVAAIGLSAGACIGLSWVRFSAEGRRTFKRLTATEWLWTSAIIVILVAWATTGFVALSTGLYKHGVGTITGGPLRGRQLVEAVYSYYLWHLAHAVPALNVTETVNWTLRHRFSDRSQGLLVLIYTIVIGLPFLYAAAVVLRRWTTDSPARPDSDRN